MKLYLDENLSPKFRHSFSTDIFQVYTYQFMGWQGKKNGELLAMLTTNNFRGIITSDQLMYSDKQLQQFQLHFFLIQSAFDTPSERLPLFELLNQFLLENLDILSKSTSSKTIITDGIVDKNLPRGVHQIWIN